jgi:lipopolysaccharide biosynthesis protein
MQGAGSCRVKARAGSIAAHYANDYHLAMTESLRDRISETSAGLSRAAIVVHAFYPDVFEDILARVQPLPGDHKLFVSTVQEHRNSLREMLDRSGRDYALYAFQNRGRDVLPFLKIYPHLQAEGFERIVKLHTKKSAHRKDGGRWRTDMFDSLLDGAILERVFEALIADPALGLVGPEGHYVPTETYLAANKQTMLMIGSRLGLPAHDVLSEGFFAGTMFVARTAALDALMGLGFADEDFEPEAGQKDGTLAHAFERAFAFAVRAGGYRLASTSDPDAPAAFQSKYSFARGRRPAKGIFGRLKEHLRGLERGVRHTMRRGHRSER